ncbi:MAG: hypothetical protein DHS20C02_04110 [Micavibrio sp.]|nr:MAG: hypothetical protein DHS20C02_04110 [Micavibrio sp.]
MKPQSYIPVYSLTLLLSATLLFSIQPMFSKMILPMLGGTPSVWNTAMLFFQVMLLGGYAYAHGTTKFMSIRAQAILHFVLLCIFTVVLPIAIPDGWTPPVDHDPTFWQLTLMGITVGGPFFVLAGSAPMLQRWFAATDHKDADNPYFLYGASNLGSMTALLAYPVIIEPLMNVPAQSLAWAIGYVSLIAMILLSAILVWAHDGKTEKKGKRKPANDQNITWAMRAQWTILAFAPSSLMLGVTTFITTDIASVPLLWILPLALYVSTFIIVFARKQIISRDSVMTIQGALVIGLLAHMIAFDIHPTLIIILHIALFFFSALACHMELAKSRPSATHLTEFYLIMSVGGALGGFFNAIIAPNIFIIPLEYMLVLVLIMFLRYSTDKDTNLKATVANFKNKVQEKGLDAFLSIEGAAIALITYTAITAATVLNEFIYKVCAAIIAICLAFLLRNRWLFAIMTAFVFALYPPGYDWGRFLYKDIIHQDRNFFGVVKVIDTLFDQRVLLHGTTNHGTQSNDEKYKLTPLSYYTESSPLYTPFKWFSNVDGPQKVAVIGLGAGVSACYSKPGRSFDYFEIDPAVIRIAENPAFFTYLRDCGSPYEIFLGDGRLTLQERPDETYDIIMLDAFSSDNIPIHLLTLEMVEVYLKKLRKGGVVVFHISNNYLDIEPILTNVAKKLNVPGYSHVNLGGTYEDTDIEYWPAHAFSMSYNEPYNKFLLKNEWSEGRTRNGVKLWTDQYSNIVSVLGNRTVVGRYEEIQAREEEEQEEENNQ